MDETSPNYDGLDVGNTRRQADAPIRAYGYQIWQSVFRWINLNSNEVLFLEGAEDFDVIRGSEAETVQVANAEQSGNLTLNSQKIIEAIDNFWGHQKRNSPRSV